MKRIYHTWDKWECYPAGFYDTKVKGRTDADCERAYADFLSNLEQFRSGLERVMATWVKSCEHYLTNENMNRIAWLGQAAACVMLGLPRRYRAGYNLLSEDQKREADALALEYLNQWLERHGGGVLTADEAKSKTQMELY
jgi:hypothetical protein